MSRIALPKFASTSISSIERRLHTRGGEGHLAQTSAGGIEDGVADGGSDHGNRRLSCSRSFDIGAVDQDAVDGWHLDPERQAVISTPVRRSYLPIIPRPFFPESTTHPLQSTPLTSIAHTRPFLNL